jgi:hypothetical protein
MNLIPALIILSVLVAQQSTPLATAAEISGAEQSHWPQQVVVTVGDIRTRIDGPKMWTLSGLDFQDQVIATEDSAYGTVVTIRGVGHLGTAHFLDVTGKPGEVEKENVTSLKLFLDGKAVSSFEPSMSLKGESFRMERTSKIRALELESSVDIRDGLLIETSHWHVSRPIDLQQSYPLMYAWAPQNMQYLFGDDGGIQKRGSFIKEGKQDDSGLEKHSCWMAVFSPATGKGGVCYVLQHPKAAEVWLQWTDAPGVYRKLRVMTFVDKIVPAGFDGTYQAAVGFFSASERDWEKKALDKVADLKHPRITEHPRARNQPILPAER